MCVGGRQVHLQQFFMVGLHAVSDCHWTCRCFLMTHVTRLAPCCRAIETTWALVRPPPTTITLCPASHTTHPSSQTQAYSTCKGKCWIKWPLKSAEAQKPQEKAKHYWIFKKKNMKQVSLQIFSEKIGLTFSLFLSLTTCVSKFVSSSWQVVHEVHCVLQSLLWVALSDAFNPRRDVRHLRAGRTCCHNDPAGF